MNVDFYICNDTFSHNGSDSISEVAIKLSDFQLLVEKIIQYKDENVLYLVKDKFASADVFGDGKSIVDILSNYSSSVSAYGKDVITILQGIFKRCKDACTTLDEMKEYLKLENENNGNAIVVLNPLTGYEKNVQVISNVKGWLEFRRSMLGKYPGDESFFLKESKKYFPDIRIHQDTSSYLREVVSSHPCRIVKYLSVLNDNLISEFKEAGGKDLNIFLPSFACKHQIDDASFEGKKDNKFYFVFDDGTNAYCEPHLKMYNDDAGNNNQHCRIHFKKPDAEERVVYVGRICRHM